jgi:H+/Cl- antiporter ClcA
MQGPLSATVLMLELTHSTGSLTVPLLLAAGLATVIARLLGAPSIYSARLADPEAAATPLPDPIPGQGGSVS